MGARYLPQSRRLPPLPSPKALLVIFPAGQPDGWCLEKQLGEVAEEGSYYRQGATAAVTSVAT